MKKKIGILICLALVFVCAVALADVKIDEKNFPDNIFREYVKQKFDKDNNGSLSEDEVKQATVINVSDLQIRDVKGIELLPYLTCLECTGNQITTIDVSKNKELETLECNRNLLTELDVRKNTKLSYFRCDENQLTKLDISKNTELEVLECYRNQLSKLDVSKNTKLESLGCSHNLLSSLDVRNNTKLIVLGCGDNLLTKLDVSRNTKLASLFCERNQLKELNISNCPILVELAKNSERGYLLGYGYGWWRNDDYYGFMAVFTDENVKVIIDNGSMVRVTSIKLNKTKATLKKGKTLQLKVKKIQPADATNTKVKWSTSDKKIATVSSKGKVKAKKKGTCIITCTAADGSGVKATCKITVK